MEEAVDTARSFSRIGRLAIVASLAALVALPAAAPAVAAASNSPRVVVIVGPVGDLTDDYRAVGAAAAREASKWTSDVVTIASPSATWPAVKRALQGATVVVYLGHGNGFPSPYRSTLYPPTEDGLGLNPVAGGDDSAHQYFGESFLARQIHLAPNALVIMSHLCYASGNSEPGMAEPTLAVAEQRVDNYGAGWLAAGAGAVIADTFGRPESYIRALFTTHTTIDAVWRSAPSDHGHALTLPSVRTPGAIVALDPTTTSSGFNRSLVVRPGLRTDQVRAGAEGAAILPIDQPVASLAPSLVTLGVEARTPQVRSTVAAAGLVTSTNAWLTVPLRVPREVALPPGLMLGVHWEPIALDPAPIALPPATGGTGAASSGSATIGNGTASGPNRPNVPSPSSSASPMASPSVLPSASPPAVPPAPADPPPIQGVVAETPTSVVAPVEAIVKGTTLRIKVGLPAAPGRYRLVTTLHDAGGVAFDPPTQSLLRSLVVRVTGPASVAYGVVPSISSPAGSTTQIAVRIANDGRLAWANAPISLADPVQGRTVVSPVPLLVGRWVPLDPGTAPEAPAATTFAPRLAPGQQAVVPMDLIAPTTPGAYLLLIDVVTPLHGSLAALGVPPAQVRVTVTPPN
jgi:hypothetical protein